METAFNWFLGKNRLHQIIYNPCTGGCYDGLEETHVNLNQGAESTISYLMARLTVEEFKRNDTIPCNPFIRSAKKNSNKEEASVFPLVKIPKALSSYNLSAEVSGSFIKIERD